MATEYQTYVVKFEGEAPPVTAGMNINGGSLCGVTFTNQLVLNDDARELIEDALDKHHLMNDRETEDFLNELLTLL